jgi:hypothetical protein
MVVIAFYAWTSASAGALVFDVTGIQSVDLRGSRDNTVLYFDVGANSTITTLAYDVDITTFRMSWLSEMAMVFTSTAGRGVIFTAAPGKINQHPGTGHYAGFVDLNDVNLGFNVGGDGILRVEFYEHYNDFSGSDGQWNSGTVTFGVQEAGDAPVPEPSTALLTGAGLALLGWIGRRERYLSKKITEHI